MKQLIYEKVEELHVATLPAGVSFHDVLLGPLAASHLRPDRKSIHQAFRSGMQHVVSAHVRRAADITVLLSLPPPALCGGERAHAIAVCARVGSVSSACHANGGVVSIVQELNEEFQAVRPKQTSSTRRAALESQILQRLRA